MGPFITHRPILNQKKHTWAYITLTRIDSNLDNDHLTSLAQQYKQITEGQTIFINLNGEFFREETINILGTKRTAINILTETTSKDNLLYISRKLKEKGFKLMMGDFVLKSDSEDLLELADIIKLNPFAVRTVSQKNLLTDLQKSKTILIADSIDNHRKFRRAQREGYLYFTGDFYLIPETTHRSEIPAYKLHYLNLLQEINQPDPDFGSIEKIIKNDISLSYNLFRLVNSAYFGLRHEVKSIRQALTLLGLNDYKKWISLKIMRGLAEDRPGVVITESLIRAHFAENLAPLIEKKEQTLDLFLMGLFSLVDVLLGRSLNEALDSLHLSQETKEAILRKSGPMGEVLKLVISYNQGQWEKLKEQLQTLSLDEQQVLAAYFEAVNSSLEVTNTLKG